MAHLYFYSYTSRWCWTKSPIILLYLILRSFFDTLLFLVASNREGRFCARWQNISNCTPACIINPAIRVSLPTLAFAQINSPTVWYNRDIVYTSDEDKSYGIQSDTGNVLVFMNVLYWPTVAKNTADSFRISQYIVSFLEEKINLYGYLWGYTIKDLKRETNVNPRRNILTENKFYRFNGKTWRNCRFSVGWFSPVRPLERNSPSSDCSLYL